jgi:hypothetical protein
MRRRCEQDWGEDDGDDVGRETGMRMRLPSRQGVRPPRLRRIELSSYGGAVTWKLEAPWPPGVVTISPSKLCGCLGKALGERSWRPRVQSGCHLVALSTGDILHWLIVCYWSWLFLTKVARWSVYTLCKFMVCSMLNCIYWLFDVYNLEWKWKRVPLTFMFVRESLRYVINAIDYLSRRIIYIHFSIMPSAIKI